MQRRNSVPSRAFMYCYGSVIVAVALGLFFKHVHIQPYLFFCGAVASGLGLWLFYDQCSFMFRSRKTHGTLVKWNSANQTWRRSNETFYYAEFEFEDADGSKHHLSSATGSTSPSQHVGYQYPVRYDPSNPDDARLDTVFDYWSPPVLILLFGGILFYVSFIAK